MIRICILSLEKRETNKPEFFVFFVQIRVALDCEKLSFDVQNIFCLENSFEFIRNLKSSFEIGKLNLNLKKSPVKSRFEISNKSK
jgi:hypothetical protein